MSTSCSISIIERSLSDLKETMRASSKDPVISYAPGLRAILLLYGCIFRMIALRKGGSRRCCLWLVQGGLGDVQGVYKGS